MKIDIPSSKVTSPTQADNIVRGIRFSPTGKDISHTLVNLAHDTIAEQIADIAVNTTHNRLRVNDSPTRLMLFDVVADDILPSHHRKYPPRVKQCPPFATEQNAARNLRLFCIIASHASARQPVSPQDLKIIVKTAKAFPKLIQFYEREQAAREATFLRINTALPSDEQNDNMRFPEQDCNVLDLTEWQSHRDHNSINLPVQSWKPVKKKFANDVSFTKETEGSNMPHFLDETTIHHIMALANTGNELATDIHDWNIFIQELRQAGKILEHIGRDAERALSAEQKTR